MSSAATSFTRSSVPSQSLASSSSAQPVSVAAASADPQKERPFGVFAKRSITVWGRSRGGFTSKLHLVVEQGRKPMPPPAAQVIDRLQSHQAVATRYDRLVVRCEATAPIAALNE